MAEIKEIEIVPDTYKPLRKEEVGIVEDLPMPQREFRKGKKEAWMTTINPEGTIIVNFVHKDYPDVFCQIQCSRDEKGCPQVYFAHVGPLDKHISYEIVENFARKVLFQTRMSLPKNPSI